MSCGERRVGHAQPASRRHAVGLVVEALREHLGEVAGAAGCAAGRSGSRRRRWCCAADARPGAPCGPSARGPSSIRLMRRIRSPSFGKRRRDVAEEAPVDLVDDLEMARNELLEEHRPATSRGPRAGACGWCRRACARSGPRPRPSRACASSSRMRISSATDSDGCVSFNWMATWSGSADHPGPLRLPEAGDDVLKRAADQEVLLQEAQRPPGLGRVVRIEHARQRLRRDVVDDGADEVAVRELGEVEGLRRGGRPEPQGVRRTARRIRRPAGRRRPRAAWTGGPARRARRSLRARCEAARGTR